MCLDSIEPMLGGRENPLNRIATLLLVGAAAMLLHTSASAQRGRGGPGSGDLGVRGERVIPRGSLADFSGEWEGVLTVVGASETALGNGIQNGIELPLRVVISGYEVSIFFDDGQGNWAQFGGQPFRIEQMGRTGYVVASIQPNPDTSETWTFNMAPFYYEQKMMIYMSRVINVAPPFEFGAHGVLEDVASD